MHIFRWLMSHPIITAWVLAALAILLNLNMGSNSTQHESSLHGNGEETHVASTAHEGSDEPVNNSEQDVAESKDNDDKDTVATADTNTSGEEVVEAQSIDQSVKKTDSQTAAPGGDHSQSAQVVTQESTDEETKPEIEESPSDENNPADAEVDTDKKGSKTKAEVESSAEAKKPVVQAPSVATYESNASEHASSASEEHGSKDSSADNTLAKADLNAEKAVKATVGAQNNQAEETDYNAMSSDDLLQLAREAFWQNNKDKSAEIYQLLVKRSPDTLSYKGELANVYWHQNKQRESAALYAEIAMPMIKQGKTREVANMLGFIGVFFPEKAREIHRIMSEQDQ